MYIGKEVSYEVPEGDHRIRVLNATHTVKGDEVIPKHEIRFTMSLPDMKNPLMEFRIGRTYRETDALELRRDLYTLLGDRIDELVGEDGNLQVENLDLLKGKEAIVTAEHVQNPKHPKPFVKIHKMRKSNAKKPLN